MNFIKKQRVAFYTTIVAALLAIIGMIVFLNAVSVSVGYIMDIYNTQIIVFAILAALLLVGTNVLSQFNFENKIIAKAKPIAIVVLNAAAAVMLCVSIGSMIFTYVDPLGQSFFSDLLADSPWVKESCTTAIVATVIIALAAIIAMVGSFFKVTKTENEN